MHIFRAFKSVLTTLTVIAVNVVMATIVSGVSVYIDTAIIVFAVGYYGYQTSVVALVASLHYRQNAVTDSRNL
jgi:hypothetical protein